MSKEIKLGVKAKDVVTGFTGIVTSITTFLTGCDRCGLTPVTKSKENKVEETNSFDILSLEYIDEGVRKNFFPEKKAKKKEKTGGPEVYSCRRAY